jgi:hypothetical protein
VCSCAWIFPFVLHGQSAYVIHKQDIQLDEFHEKFVLVVVPKAYIQFSKEMKGKNIIK